MYFIDAIRQLTNTVKKLEKEVASLTVCYLLYVLHKDELYILCYKIIIL